MVAVIGLGNMGMAMLGRLLATEDGRSLVAATKRATNILREEEKKSGAAFTGGG